MEKFQAVDARWLHDRPWTSSYRSWLWRRPTKAIAAVLLLIFCIKVSRLRSYSTPFLSENSREHFLRDGAFERIAITGFVNHGKTNATTCADLRYNGVIEVQQGFHLHDDIIEIAHALEHHPRVDYTGFDQSLTHDQMIRNTWVQMAQSSIWLEKYQVYLAVSRVFWYDTDNKAWSCVSFLRGQIYDIDWNELRGYNIHWQGQKITFPTVFHIPSPYTTKGAFYGPEDPRIIIEQGVEDAEPVIVFNMLSDIHTLKRAMYIHRPFSNSTTILSINGQEERNDAEKNWQPFFYRDATLLQLENARWPDHYIHFVYNFDPLEIMKCHIHNGWCDFVYRQDMGVRQDEVNSVMRGGTNLNPIASFEHSGATVYVGFPRTHVEDACTKEAMYRPALMVMTAFNNSFHLDYMSSSVDFGDKAMSDAARDDPCGEGRILIMNSIAKWDRDAQQDVMTLSYTVDDSTTQVLRLSGVADFVLNLPYIGGALEIGSSNVEKGQSSKWSTVGFELLGCSVKAAFDYSLEAALPSNGTNLRKQRLDAEKEKNEREKELKEEKQKEDDEDKRRKEEQKKKPKDDDTDEVTDDEKRDKEEQRKIQEMIDITKAEAARKQAEEKAQEEWESRKGAEYSKAG